MPTPHRVDKFVMAVHLESRCPWSQTTVREKAGRRRPSVVLCLHPQRSEHLFSGRKSPGLLVPPRYESPHPPTLRLQAHSPRSRTDESPHPPTLPPRYSLTPRRPNTDRAFMDRHREQDTV